MENQSGSAVAAAVDVYTVKGIKTFRGMDGEGLNATLCRNGKPVCAILDEGRGGEMRFDWIDAEGWKSKEGGRFNKFIEEKKLALSDEKSKKHFGMSERALFGGDVFVWNLVNIELDNRRMKRHCKTKTLFQVDAEIGTDSFHTLKGVGPDVRAHLEKKYVGRKLYVLNDKFDK